MAARASVGHLNIWYECMKEKEDKLKTELDRLKIPYPPLPPLTGLKSGTKEYNKAKAVRAAIRKKAFADYDEVNERYERWLLQPYMAPPGLRPDEKIYFLHSMLRKDPKNVRLRDYVREKEYELVWRKL